MKSFGKLALLFCLFNGPSSIVNSQSPSQLYQTANQLYKSNQFAEAAADYEKILGQGYKKPEVYYNLGNCYYKQNNLGKSILNYERGLKLAPDDEDLQHNLKLANLKIVDKIQPVPQLGFVTAWNNFISAQSAKGWGIFAVVSVWLAFIAFGIYFFFRAAKRLIFILAPLFLFLSIGFGILSFLQNQKENNSDEAVLLIPNAFIKSAPDTNGNDLFLLHEGSKFQLLDRVGDWHKIRLADGKVGWIEKGSFERI